MRGTASAVVFVGLSAGLGLVVAVAQDTPPPSPPPAEPEFVPPKTLALRRVASKEAGVDAAVRAGLDWLRRHRAKDGHWSAEKFAGACTGERCGGSGEPMYDTGVTALAALAFLGAGRTQAEGDDAAVVGDALKYLVASQDSDGRFGPSFEERNHYNHAAATMAVAEAYWLTGDKALAAPTQRAATFLLKTRNPYLAWRYAFGGRNDGSNDTSATAWALVAFRTCDFAGAEVVRSVAKDSLAWFEKMTDPSTGRVGYQQRGGPDARLWLVDAPRPEAKEAPVDPNGTGPIRKRLLPLIPMPNSGPVRTGAGIYDGPPANIDARFPSSRHSALAAAAGAATAVWGGGRTEAALVDLWAETLAAAPPSSYAAGFLDLHYALFGSLLNVQRPIDALSPPPKKGELTWRASAVKDLVGAQQTKACAAGSWLPESDPFGAAGGRVYATSMALLALEAPNRFPKVWKEPPRKPQRK